MDKRESAKNETARINAKGYFHPKREIRVYYKGVCIESRIARDINKGGQYE